MYGVATWKMVKTIVRTQVNDPMLPILAYGMTQRLIPRGSTRDLALIRDQRFHVNKNPNEQARTTPGKPERFKA